MMNTMGFGVALWSVGLVLLLAGGVTSVIGLLGKPAPLQAMDEPGNGTIKFTGQTTEEAEAFALDQRRRLRFTLVGALLANVGGLLSAFGSQPWAGA